MTLNGAIMQLVEMRENSMMPEFFKPYLDKVIETVSECEEPSSNTEIIRCRECRLRDTEYCNMAHGFMGMKDDDYCSYAERREVSE